MKYNKDERVILTLDAGGTNFVFSALQKGKTIVKPIIKPSNGHDLLLCLDTIKIGFQGIIKKCPILPSAISFSFPGPTDYTNGIIGDLVNLTGFRGGVPLVHILEEHFKIPVFINNDGDLFAYGEAIAGILPEINKKLKDSG
jgi:glucokinase